MIEWLAAADRWLFILINSTLANPVGDLLWPVITDYDKTLVVRILLLGLWLWLMIRGGARGRTVALLLIPILAASDQLSSSVVKPLFARPRPCHMIDGVRLVQDIHMLVDCGPGKSFPSSHAVNNAAVAAALTYYYRRLWPWFVGWSFIIALSRVAVGVHYPSDVIGGALLGAAIGLAVTSAWESTCRQLFPRWRVARPEELAVPPEKAGP